MTHTHERAPEIERGKIEQGKIEQGKIEQGKIEQVDGTRERHSRFR